MTFALAAETIKVLKWEPSSWLGKKINVERSLRFGDRIHGHIVTGHVDSLGTVLRADLQGASFFLDINIAKSMGPFVWKKGSITLNGVSLTVNDVVETQTGEYTVSVCLIPETMKRTNLGDLTKGARVNVEPDYLARAIQRSLEIKKD
jgi:riboflavin synthase